MLLGAGSRVALSWRERLVMVEPRGADIVAITLRASEEVRTPAFTTTGADIDADMVAVAETIIKRRSGHFDPSTFRDRYQEALRALIEAKMRGLPVSRKRFRRHQKSVPDAPARTVPKRRKG